MKLCSTCNIEKQIEQFGVNKLTKSGIFAACKECKKLEKKRYKDKNREQVLEKSRIYANKRYHENVERELNRANKWRIENPEKYRESLKKSAAKSYQKFKPERLRKAREYVENNIEKVRLQRRKWKEENKDYVKKKTYEYIARYPEKKKAVASVNNAIMYGKMIRPSKCSRCPNENNIEGHHTDYSKPLEVIWLCRKCHNKEHGK
tara:strand:- start:1541 stop:2155 length:615 start_codon:yes stop_codon:yes gene_type:complete